ncbi:MAG: Aspartate 1-decarboxylase [Elusimicrobia bacterium]|nr:Aspartate 1-decarboxylase [Elusimicrobiota bacterium]
MLRRMCRAKIHRATITASRLDYEGSIEVDQVLMEKAGILEHEMVLVANLANGQRFETYVIKGARHSGVIGLNGAAARLGSPGDKIIIMSVAWMEETMAKKLKPQFVQVDQHNHVIAIRPGVKRG